MNHIGIGMNGIGASADHGVRADKAHHGLRVGGGRAHKHADKAQAMSSKNNIRRLGRFVSCGTGIDYQLRGKSVHESLSGP